ncbi:MAG: NUDIX domain-containing protein [Patescibacteria group bacterium]
MIGNKADSPDELLDLVDENDQIIGTVLKSEAHHNPKLIHREVAVLLYTRDNHLLLQKRSLLKKVHPGQWAETCAGHIAKGELPLTAARKSFWRKMR